eukprot:jgi/Botrbrau1/6619/Bobra.104_2s0006.1
MYLDLEAFEGRQILQNHEAIGPHAGLSVVSTAGSKCLSMAPKSLPEHQL